MKKIPTMFQRDETKSKHPIINVIRPECQWVLDGEGVATRKLDGTNVKIENGKFYKRQKPLQGNYDEASYVEVEPVSPENRWIMEGYNALENKEDGIYEAVGPKIQGNPEKLEAHQLIKVVPHISDLGPVPRDFEGLKEFLSVWDIEGVVFHHPDGRMAKIKKRDFGFTR